MLSTVYTTLSCVVLYILHCSVVSYTCCLLWSLSMYYVQSSYSNVVIHEGSEPENFFWVALGGKDEYEKVNNPVNGEQTIC